ncbi:carbohydrate-binding protein [Streptomyces sp. 8N706]|uniref:carbohydrate-binding protein n=1 Tax=Streptomyces sp. 8N706 TaxID=3457416 RepID=UPI003FD1EE90
MTAGNNGASTPENDDPFGYLYRSEGGDGGASGTDTAPRTGGYGYPGPAAQPGVPRTSYNKVTRVGERQYGQQSQQAPQQSYGRQPNAHYAAPETLPGGAPRRPAPPSPAGHGGGRGPNSKGLLIGAISVVAVVLIGIGVAMLTNGGDDTKKDQAGNSGPADSVDEGKGQPDEPADEGKGEGEKKFSSDRLDGASLRLGGTAGVARDVPNARSKTGAYVHMDQAGATATYSVDVPKKGQYTLFTGYGVPGADTKATLTVNSSPRSEPLKLDNYAGAKPGEWEKGWTMRYDWLQLNKGTNTIEFSCGPTDTCNFNLDYVQLKAGQVKD